MQYEKGQEAKKFARKKAIEKDRKQAKIMVRYLLFYLVLFVLSVVTRSMRQGIQFITLAN